MSTVTTSSVLTYRERQVDRNELLPAVGELLTQGWRLALMHGADDGGTDLRVVYVFTQTQNRCSTLTVRVPRNDPWVPTIAAVSYAGSRFERQLFDLYGIAAQGHPLPHELVHHSQWPRDWHPMRTDAGPVPELLLNPPGYPFPQVEGQGVYEIPVGPIHAGLIEPGHFRFSVVGETIVHMTPRLWFMHRGIEKLMVGRSVESGLELAERISGDTSVGHSLAYVMAVEAAAGIEVTEPVAQMRALILELERIYNHINDIGAIVNDVAYGIIHAHAGRLREQMLRLNKQVTGHRLLRGAISVGGAALRHPVEPTQVADIVRQTQDLVQISLQHHVVADRLRGTSPLPAEVATEMGTLGYVARASSVTVDARADQPFVDLGESFVVVTQDSGDVHARFKQRADELNVSAVVVRQLAEQLTGRTGYGDHTGTERPKGQDVSAVQGTTETRSGVGVVEGWRGTIVHRVELADDGTLARVAPVDPSFFNWPALPVALRETIVPDFPLTNKSFNLSYAGNDL